MSVLPDLTPFRLDMLPVGGTRRRKMQFSYMKHLRVRAGTVRELN